MSLSIKPNVFLLPLDTKHFFSAFIRLRLRQFHRMWSTFVCRVAASAHIPRRILLLRTVMSSLVVVFNERGRRMYKIRGHKTLLMLTSIQNQSKISHRVLQESNWSYNNYFLIWCNHHRLTSVKKKKTRYHSFLNHQHVFLSRLFTEAFQRIYNFHFQYKIDVAFSIATVLVSVDSALTVMRFG